MDELARRDDAVEHLERMGRLTEALLERDAVPDIRLAYILDPTMYAGGYGRSRMENFKRSGVTGRDIYRSASWREYLLYFIKGPDLPNPTIEGFCKIIKDDAGTSGMVLDQLRRFVRREVRERRLTSGDAGEEFFKLAHEIGRPDLADSIRSAAKSVRR